MKEFWVYTLLRVVLLAATWGIVLGLWVLIAGNANLFLTLVIAFVISGIGSYIVLQRPRENFAQRVSGRADRIVSKYEEARAREDVD